MLSLRSYHHRAMSEWRNWQTRKTKDLVSVKDVGVQVPPPTPHETPASAGVSLVLVPEASRMLHGEISKIC